jgi:hypothetical protein
MSDFAKELSLTRAEHAARSRSNFCKGIRGLSAASQLQSQLLSLHFLRDSGLTHSASGLQTQRSADRHRVRLKANEVEVARVDSWPRMNTGSTR